MCAKIKSTHTLLLTPMTDEEKLVTFRMSMPETIRNLLKAKSAKEGKTMNEALLELVDHYVESEKPPTPKKKR